MLLKQLSLDEKRDFVCIAALLSIAEKPVETSTDVSASSYSFKTTASPRLVERTETEQAVIDELLRRCDPDNDNGLAYPSDGRYGHQDIARVLVERLSPPSHDGENFAHNRVPAILSVLREVLNGRKASMPSAPKLMLFEFMLFALSKGNITGVEWQLLNEFKHHHQLENQVFDDLLERARCTHSEAQKTLAIILE